MRRCKNLFNTNNSFGPNRTMISASGQYSTSRDVNIVLISIEMDESFHIEHTLSEIRLMDHKSAKWKTNMNAMSKVSSEARCGKEIFGLSQKNG